MKRRASVLILGLFIPALALADGPAYRLIEGTVPTTFAPTDTRLLTAAGDRLFFVGTSPSTGTEVWTSDGSPEGTNLVRDIFPGPDILQNGPSIPEADDRLNPTPGPLASLGGTLFFAAPTGTSRCVLWRSDGSSAGTVPVVDPGQADGPVLPCMPLGEGAAAPTLPVSGGRLFFGAFRGSSADFGLWSTDGTEAGTRYLAPLVLPQYGALLATDVSGTLAFQNFDAFHGWGLWRSDGTPGGTRFVGSLGGPIGMLSAHGRSVVVQVNPPGASTFQLWLADVEGGGATLLRSLHGGLQGIAWLGGTIVFSVYGQGLAVDDGLWRSDGTPDGTFRYSSLAGISGLAFAGDVLVGTSAAGLFRTDGTADGTLALRSYSLASAPVALGREVWFTARDAQAGLGVWRSDGTEAGTRLVVGGTGGSGFTALGSRVAFVGTSGSYPEQLQPSRDNAIVWTSDGTPEGTGPVLPARISTATRNLSLLATAGRGAFFTSAGTAWSGTADVWFSDGRPDKAVQVISMPQTGVVAASVLRGELLFVTQNAYVQLWKSDGTPAGTVGLATQLGSGGSGRFTKFASVGDALLLLEQNPPSGTRVWRTDGTLAGTTVVE
ncbi:MAG TPA: hypothetical protein VMN04_10340, partial [Thermoanaerobaculia bacterium]|nr:hypothetical protein [Thermoanaerobaculia bacterium]